MEITQEIITAINKYLYSTQSTQVDLANKLGLSPVAVHAWLNGKSFSIKNKYFIELETLIRPYLDSIKTQPFKTNRVPIYKLPLITGEFIQEKIDGKECSILTESTISKNAFAFKINDPSLGVIFGEGSVIICDPSRTPQHENYVMIQFPNSKEIILRKLYIDMGIKYSKSPNPFITELTKLSDKDIIIATVCEIKLSF